MLNGSVIPTLRLNKELDMTNFSLEGDDKLMSSAEWNDLEMSLNNTLKTNRLQDSTSCAIHEAISAAAQKIKEEDVVIPF